MARNTRDLIYYGALEAFSEQGFAATTMDYIAEKSGVVKRTLYYNFKTKEDLFRYVIDRAVDELTNLLDTSLAKHKEFSRKWQHVIDTHCKYYQENTFFFHLLIQQMWKKDEASPFAIQELFKGYFSRLDQELRNDQQAGYIDANLDIFTCSASVFGMMTIPAARAMLNNQPIYTEERVQTISNLILSSLERMHEHE
mgnify:CR=1 FL=1